jgi:hypothetical protein
MKAEVAVDSRGRVPLAFRKQDHQRYIAEENDDGTITLTPLVRVHAMRLVPPVTEGTPSSRPDIPAVAW